MVVQFATARAPDAIASSSRAFSRRSSALSASAILPSAAEKFNLCYVLYTQYKRQKFKFKLWVFFFEQPANVP